MWAWRCGRPERVVVWRFGAAACPPAYAMGTCMNGLRRSRARSGPVRPLPLCDWPDSAVPLSRSPPAAAHTIAMGALVPALLHTSGRLRGRRPRPPLASVMVNHTPGLVRAYDQRRAQARPMRALGHSWLCIGQCMSGRLCTHGCACVCWRCGGRRGCAVLFAAFALSRVGGAGA